VATLIPRDSCLIKAVYKILISDIFRVSALVSPISRSTVFYQCAAVHYSIELTDILSSRLCTLLKLTHTCIMCKLKYGPGAIIGSACAVHTEYSNKPGLNLCFNILRVSPMFSYRKSPGHGATAPFTSAYGQARTPYQFTAHSLSHILLGPQRFPASCSLLTV
jgi:hypothetical protein